MDEYLNKVADRICIKWKGDSYSLHQLIREVIKTSPYMKYHDMRNKVLNTMNNPKASVDEVRDFLHQRIMEKVLESLKV